VSTITVRVTGTDIRRGLPGDALSCPIARALRRATGRRWAASRTVLRVAEEDGVLGGRHLPAPPEAEAFMRDYDRDRKVRPFTFTLDLPDAWLTQE
jgi:hypothetical protein